MGHYYWEFVYEHIQGDGGYYKEFYTSDMTSDWSSPQTLTIPDTSVMESPSTNSTPSWNSTENASPTPSPYALSSLTPTSDPSALPSPTTANDSTADKIQAKDYTLLVIITGLMIVSVAIGIIAYSIKHKGQK
jgi:hypothetical protein